MSLENNNPSFVVWFTGLSGAGKTTLAEELAVQLRQLSKKPTLLDGDILRTGLCSDLGFSLAERTENLRRAAEVAKLMLDSGALVVASFISPTCTDRAMVRSIVGPDAFFEVYVYTPLEVCESRDPKGLYKKARRGEFKNFTGIDSPYEPPSNPDFRIDTSNTSTREAVLALLSELRKKSFID